MIMKKLVALISILALFGCLGIISSSACTAFSVKSSSNTFYGKNWDFNQNRKKDVIITLKDLGNNLSSVNFMLSSGFLCSAINSNGFYVTCNANTDTNKIDSEFNSNNIDIGQLREQGVKFTKISDLKEYIANKKVTCNGYEEHVFFADKYGDSCLIETDNSKTYAIDDQNNFLAVTNFPLHSLSNLGDLDQAPCERYNVAYSYINEKSASFTFDDGIETLRMTRQSYSTIYSFIYDVNENAIYLFLNQNFNKIWKISFETKSITTYKGFDKSAEFKLNSDGVLLTDLEYFQKTGTIKVNNDRSNQPYKEIRQEPVVSQLKSEIDFSKVIIIVFGVFFLAAIIILFIEIKNKK